MRLSQEPMFCGDETCWAEEGKGLIVMGQHSKFGNDMHSEDSLSPFRNGRSLHYDRVRHCCHRYPRWCTWNHPLPCSERRCRRWREFQADRCRKWTRSLRDARATSEPLQITTTLICRKALDQGPGRPGAERRPPSVVFVSCFRVCSGSFTVAIVLSSV